MHMTTRSALFACVLITTGVTVAQGQPGLRIPSVPGVTRTTADIMAQQASAPAVTTIGELHPLLRPPLV